MVVWSRVLRYIECVNVRERGIKMQCEVFSLNNRKGRIVSNRNGRLWVKQI